MQRSGGINRNKDSVRSKEVEGPMSTSPLKNKKNKK